MQNREELVNKFLYEDILPEMFKRVNAPVDDIKEFTKKNNWYWLYSWKKSEEINYIIWLADYFKTNKKAFTIIGKPFLNNNKENRTKLASGFVSNYGWKISEEDLFYKNK